MQPTFYTDPTFVDRLRNAAFLEQLYRLRRSDEHRSLGAHYNSVTCALALFELLMSRGSLAEELTQDDLTGAFFPFLRRLDELAGVESDPAVHAGYLDELLERLAPNVKVEAEYLDLARDNPSRRVPFVFLRFREGAAGEPFLELSAEATNIYLGMLIRDVADVQRASEYLLDENIRRGHIQAAVTEARVARQASESYRQEVLTVIRRTQRDLRSVDWHRDVPELLDRASAHVGERIQAESAISERVRAQLDADFPEAARPAQEGRDPLEKRALLVQIQDTVDETQRRHGQLLRTLHRARQTYFEEQDGQFVLSAGAPGAAHLARDVLGPLLELPAERAAALASPLLAQFFPKLDLGLNLVHLIEHLATPKRAVTRSALEVEDRVVEPFEYGLERYTDAERERAFAYLREGPARLSDVLARAGGEPTAVRQLIVLLAYRGYCGLGFSGHHEGLSSEPVSTLETPDFAGDDLLVTPYLLEETP